MFPTSYGKVSEKKNAADPELKSIYAVSTEQKKEIKPQNFRTIRIRTLSSESIL